MPNNIEEPNNMRDFTIGSKNDEKLSKKPQLNSNMSIAPIGRDEYESKLHSIGGEE